MEKFIKWFQKNGVLKILASFGLLFLICWLFDITNWNIFRYLIWLPGAYLIVAWVTMVIDLSIRIYWERYHKKHDTFSNKK